MEEGARRAGELATVAFYTMRITDIAAVARIAREAGVLTMVENTFATPYNTQPLALGADVGVHSATKALGGYHHLVLEAIVGTRAFVLTCWEQLRIYGGSADPFAAWLLLVGLQTPGLRWSGSTGPRWNASGSSLTTPG